MTCPRCQQEHPADRNFCADCGTPLAPLDGRVQPAASYAEIQRALTEAHEQQTATGEILKVISRSAFDLEPVLQTLIENATRLCGAEHGHILRLDGEVFHLVAAYAASEAFAEFFRRNPWRVGRQSAAGRAVLESRPIHIPDILADPAYVMPDAVRLAGHRTILAVPMLRERAIIGVIVIWRTEVRPFTDKQIELVTTFADQAVIAIENVRLLMELQRKNKALTEAHAQVTEALEQQTATAEILRVISSSPTDVQRIFEAIVESALRLCEASYSSAYRVDGDTVHLVAHNHRSPESLARLARDWPMPLESPSLTCRAIRERAVVHLDDTQGDLALPVSVRERSRAVDQRAFLAVPMLRDGIPIGAIRVARREPMPFSDQQIALLQTFADQAVIAIENGRLFKELEARNRDVTHALEQQTATSEILRVIARSPTNLQPVMDAVAESAARLCGADNVVVFRSEGGVLRVMAVHGPRPAVAVPITRDAPSGRAVLEARTVHVPDLPAAVDEYPEVVVRIRETGSRALLTAPLLSKGQAVGTIAIRRDTPGPFSDKQIKLLETFADQAVIAIENVRLFNELEARTAELTRSVAQLTALSEVGQAVSSTLDVEAVLGTIVSRASLLAGADGSSIYEYDQVSEQFHLRATHNLDGAFVEAIRAVPLRKGEGLMGRATETRQPVQIPDIAAPETYQSSLRNILIRFGYRALLSVPLLREDQIIGSLSLNRKVPGAFPREVIDVLTTFGTQSALALQNARLFHELEDKSRQLEIASRHKSEFLANMSHELRTPLNAIIGFSEVLADRMFGDLNDKQEEYLKDIHSSGAHLLSLINDILDLSKVEAGRLDLELSRFHLPTAVDDALTLVRERASRHGIALEATVKAGVGDIVADERKVKQILLNLLSNAVKFTPEGGRVGVSATPADGAITIAVSDTGSGIASEDLDAVFEEFRQVGRDVGRKREGTGLGLTLTKKFVELHGGRIWVRSALGQGSTFAFTLPVRM